MARTGETKTCPTCSTVFHRRPGTTDASWARTRLCSPGFAKFARVIEDSAALQAKELEIMARYTDAIAAAIREELGARELDAKIAANVLVGVLWQFFRNARSQALAGRSGPAAAKRLRADLRQAFQLLEGGLVQLEAR